MVGGRKKFLFLFFDHAGGCAGISCVVKLLDVIPDDALLEQLNASRGKGRNDYSMRTLWGVLVLSIALRHQNIEACLGELRRNESLRRLIGIESEEHVPKKSIAFHDSLAKRAVMPVLTE